MENSMRNEKQRIQGRQDQGSLPVVTTSAGSIAGVREEGVRLCKFLGIPYAEPPLGELRFKPPMPKKPWAGTLDASRFGPAGPQVFDPTEGNWFEFTGEKGGVGGNWVGSEDNLVLNIWTPAPDESRRPVVVWVHGGANWLESSRLATYHGDRLAARGDVVFVSINYRLGVFGWLDISVLGGNAYEGSHSNGLRDQMLALRWIRDNIAAFGGDPENITVMGESAGSIDLSWLLANGQLDGIARRVVLMSGIAGLPGLSGDLRTGFTPAWAQQQARDFLGLMGVSSLPELLTLTTGQIMERVVAINRDHDTLLLMDSQFWPRTLPDFAPADPFRAGGGGDIDVMIGYTAYEMGLWLTWDETLDKHPSSWAAGKIRDFDPALQGKAVALYDSCFSSDTPGSRGMHMMGDSIFVMPSLWFADQRARSGGNVWMYQFDWQTDPRRRALHAADQTFLFDKHETDAGRHLLGMPEDEENRAARAALTAAMQDAVLAFARHGDPNRHKNRNLPEWPRYGEQERAVMSFDLKCRITKDPAKDRRVWWYEHIYGPLFGR